MATLRDINRVALRLLEPSATFFTKNQSRKNDRPIQYHLDPQKESIT